MKRFCLLWVMLCSLHASAQLDEDFDPFAMDIPVPTECGWQFMDMTTRELDTVCYEDFDTRTAASYRYVLKKNGLWSVQSGAGRENQQFTCDSLHPIHYEAFLIKKGTNWSLLDYKMVSHPLDIDSFYVGEGIVHLYYQGKCGLIDEEGKIYRPIYNGIQPFRSQRAGILDQKYTGLCLVSDQGYLNLVDTLGAKLLPDKVVDVQEDDFGFIRYFNGSWNYLNLSDRSLIESKDRDLIPYAPGVYKIYNADRNRGTLHFNGKVFGSEEDYFYLNMHWIAVRSGGKIGVISTTGNWILRPKYDRVEWMDEERNAVLFRFFIGDSCGMVDARGVELISPRYANILPTGDPDRFIVFDRKRCGMVNRKGESILPISYDHLQLIGNHVEVQKDEHFGICTRDGKEILPPKYKNMFTEYLNVDQMRIPVFFAQKYNGNWQIANKDGLLSQDEFSHFQFGGTAVKGYVNSEISLYAFDEKGDVEMEEHFSGLPILSTGKNEKLRTKIVRGYDFSYLEENQKNGLYGLRYYTQHGLAVDPKYTRARVDGFGNYLCPLPKNTSEPLADSITMEAFQHFITLYPLNGSEDATNLIYSSAYLKGGFWSYEALGTNSYGKDCFLTATVESPFNLNAAQNAMWKYMINDGQVLKYYKGNARICPIEEADLSLYDYFRYRNALDHFRLDSKDHALVMNPHFGVRFDGGEIRGSQYDNLKDTRTIPMRSYVAFSELEEWNAPELIYMKKLDNAYGVLQDLNWEDESEPRKIEKIKALKHHEIDFLNIFELEMDSVFLRTVHPEYPSFEFESDSLNLGYFHGRIIGISPEGGYILRAPNDSVYAEAAFIRYLGNTWFALLENGSWRLVDRNGQSVYPGSFTEIGNWNGKELMLSTAENTDFIDASAKLIRRQAVKSTPINAHLLRVARPEGAVAFHIPSGREFPLEKDDKFLSNGWILRSADNGKFTLLSTFTGLQLEVSSDKKPEVLGFSVLTKSKSTIYLTDTNLRIIRLKKIEDYDLFEQGILLVRNKKGKRLYNEAGTLLMDYTKASFSQEGTLVLVTQRDTSYFINQTGETFTYLEGKKQMSIAVENQLNGEETDEFACVQEGAFWGLKHEDQWLIPPKYGRLQKLADGNYQAVYTHTKMLVNTDFKKIYMGFFDRLIDLGGGYMLICKGGHSTVIDREGTCLYSTFSKNARIN